MVLGEVVICPICEAQYKVAAAENGKLFLERFIFSGNDAGEL